ncbi:Transposon Ty3-G Gag-Pol polyprotein [Labeo rohita]|uniref:Transposon Ty3-G Gag-Pol polyprotein n=1 Tax=Labeo rohita TaxID=84645 RepID=A0ABQ8M488_LABRO|nr:Transposon Ty3-G Gag-Pol polyprotein [Labeo rohita]
MALGSRSIDSPRVSAELELQSTYNLIWKSEVDKWKTAFVTPTGHYKYLVMLYGLISASFIFQGYMNEVFWKYLHQFDCLHRQHPSVLPEPSKSSWNTTSTSRLKSAHSTR